MAGGGLLVALFAKAGDVFNENVLDVLVRVLEVLLFHQAYIAVPFFQLALSDALKDIFGLAGSLRLGFVDGYLPFHNVSRNLFPGHVFGVGCHDVHREISRQLLKLLGAGYEIGLAVELDHCGDLAAVVDIGTDDTFMGIAVGLLGRGRQPLLAQIFHGFVKIAIIFVQRCFAVENAGSRSAAQLFHHLCCDRSHTPPPDCLAAFLPFCTVIHASTRACSIRVIVRTAQIFRFRSRADDYV